MSPSCHVLASSDVGRQARESRSENEQKARLALQASAGAPVCGVWLVRRQDAVRDSIASAEARQDDRQILRKDDHHSDQWDESTVGICHVIVRSGKG
jgi:hypothetical protein